jgi:cell division septum initiation protein DivIVA
MGDTMGVEQVRMNASRQLSRTAEKKYDPAVDLFKSACRVESELAANNRRLHALIRQTQEGSKLKIHEQLSNLVALTEYPRQRSGFVLETGTGPTSVIIDVAYSGLNGQFFRWWKHKPIEIKIIINYDVKVEEYEHKFPADDKRGNVKDIATFLKSVADRIYQISRELSEDHPLHVYLSDFESELILKTSELLADPNVSAIYLNLDTIDDIADECQKKLNGIVNEARKESERTIAEVRKLQAKIKERWAVYESEMAVLVKQLRDELTTTAQQAHNAMAQAALREKEAVVKRALADAEKERSKIKDAIEGERKKLQKEIDTLEKELDKLRSKKCDVTEATRNMLTKLDRAFPNYDFGRNGTLTDKEDVSPTLRAECARKIGEIIARDPDVSQNDAAAVLDFMARRTRRSAGTKFNGVDLRSIIETVCWILVNLNKGSIKWLIENFNRHPYDRTQSADEIRTLAENLVNQDKREFGEGVFSEKRN